MIENNFIAYVTVIPRNASLEKSASRSTVSFPFKIQMKRVHLTRSRFTFI